MTNKNSKMKPDVFSFGNKRSGLAGLFEGLYSPENTESYISKILSKNGYNPYGIGNPDINSTVNPKVDAMRGIFNEASGNPLGGTLNSAYGNTGIGTTTKLAGNWIRDHKLKSAGLGLGIGANLAGLFDNPNMAGQLLGGAGAGIGANLLAKHLGSPLTASGTALAALGGGTLGSLFDKLMYKKQQEQQFLNQYGG